MKMVRLNEQQEEYLRNNYGKKTLDEIGAHIGISAPTVRVKAIKLGLKNGVKARKCQWNDEQINWLRKNYPSKSLPDLAEHIGFSIPTIQKKALELGLKKEEGYSIKKFYRRYVKDYKNAV